MKIIWQHSLLFLSLVFISSSAVFAGAYRETLILFDSTGSMGDQFLGKTKVEHAADAVNNILQQMPQDEKVGLRTIGIPPDKLLTLASSKVTRKEICVQTYLRNRIRTFNQRAIKGTLSELFAFGPTPLAYSLRTTIENDFHFSTPEKHIILITDGYETCDGNPCEYIKMIMKKRKDIVIDVVAIGANSYDLNYLKCLTDATGGDVYDIQTPTEINPTIEQLTKDILNVQEPEQQPEDIFPETQLQNEFNVENVPNIIYKNYVLEFSD